MENEHSINLFELRVATRNKPEEYQFLDNVDGSGTDLLHLFGKFLQALPQDRLIERGKKHFGRPEDLVLAGRTVRVSLQCGSSGIESTLTDKAGSLKAERKTPDVELLRFRLVMCVPVKSLVGYLAVEEIHGRTLTVEFRDEFIAQFKRACPQQILSIRTCAIENAWRAAEGQANALVQRIRILRTTPPVSAMTGVSGLDSIPKDAGKVVTEIDYHENPFEASMLSKLRREVDRRLGRAKEDENGGVRTIETVDEADLEDIDVVADVLMPNGKSVKVRYSNTRPPRIAFEIDAPAGGKVHDDLFCFEARRHLGDLVRQSGGALEPDWWDTKWTVPGKIGHMEIEVDSGLNHDGLEGDGGSGAISK